MLFCFLEPHEAIQLVFSNLSKIIYHNITPSASYDATRTRLIARIFLEIEILRLRVVPEVGLEPTWDCSRQILSLVRIPISPLRRELLIIRFAVWMVKIRSVYLSMKIAGTGFSLASPNSRPPKPPSELLK